MSFKSMSIVLITAMLAVFFPVSSAGAQPATPSSTQSNALNTDEQREYGAFKNLYTPQQFKTFVEQTLVTLPGGSTITVLRYLVSERENRAPAGARIAVATNSRPGALAQVVDISAAEFLAGLRRSNNSLSNALTAPLAAHDATLSAQKQQTVQRQLGSAITNALTTVPAAPPPAPPPPVTGAAPTEMPSMAPAIKSPPSPTPPPRTCTKPADPAPSSAPQESVKDIQDEVTQLSQSSGNWTTFSTQYPDLSYKVCLAETGRGTRSTAFPVENTISLYPTLQSLNGTQLSRRFNGSIYNKFDIETSPSLGLNWESAAKGEFFGTSRDLVRFVASIQSQNDQTAAVSYQVFLGLSSIPIVSGSLQADHLSVDLQDQPQQVISFSRKVNSVPLGFLNLNASFDISGNLSNDYVAVSTSRSLYFSMSPKIDATATGTVALSALVSSASLNGTLTIIDYSGQVGGAVVFFSDPFTESHEALFADRYISRAQGTALKGSLSLDITLICPAALKKLLCVKKSFPLYTTAGYPLVTQILPERDWEVFAPGTALSSDP